MDITDVPVDFDHVYVLPSERVRDRVGRAILVGLLPIRKSYRGFVKLFVSPIRPPVPVERPQIARLEAIAGSVKKIDYLTMSQYNKIINEPVLPPPPENVLIREGSSKVIKKSKRRRKQPDEDQPTDTDFFHKSPVTYYGTPEPIQVDYFE